MRRSVGDPRQWKPLRKSPGTRPCHGQWKLRPMSPRGRISHGTLTLKSPRRRAAGPPGHRKLIRPSGCRPPGPGTWILRSGRRSLGIRSAPGTLTRTAGGPPKVNACRTSAGPGSFGPLSAGPTPKSGSFGPFGPGPTPKSGSFGPFGPGPTPKSGSFGPFGPGPPPRPGSLGGFGGPWHGRKGGHGDALATPTPKPVADWPRGKPAATARAATTAVTAISGFVSMINLVRRNLSITAPTCVKNTLAQPPVASRASPDHASSNAEGPRVII